MKIVSIRANNAQKCSTYAKVEDGIREIYGTNFRKKASDLETRIDKTSIFKPPTIPLVFRLAFYSNKYKSFEVCMHERAYFQIVFRLF